MSVRVVKAVFDNSPQKGSSRLVLLALAEWSDDDGIAYPSVASIARKARVSEATVHTAIRRLAAAGELIVTPNAGRHGTNLYRILLGGGQQLALLEGGAAFEGGPSSAPVLVATPEPSSPRTSQPERGTDGQGPDSGPLQNLHPPADRTIPDRAARLWVDLRRRAKLDRRFCDRAALATLRERATLAVADGASWPDVEKALRAKATGPKASPYYVDEWIRTEHDERIDREQRHEAEQGRMRSDRERDQRIDAHWRDLEAKHPGKTRREIRELEGAPSPWRRAG